MNYKDIDFNPLKNRRISDADWVRQHRKKGELYNIAKLILILITVLFGACTVIILSIISFTTNPLISSSVMFMLVVFYIAYVSFRKDPFDKSLDQFATANGWSTNTQVPLNPVLVALNFDFSLAKVSGDIGGRSFWLHNISAPVMNNRSLPTFDALSIEFPKILPTVLIFPGANSFFAFTDALAKSFGLIPLRLEGDFDSKARAYCEQGKEIDALSYITPDVMDILAHKTRSVIIYADHYVYVSPSESISNTHTLIQLFNDSQKITKEIMEKQRYY